MLSHHLRRLFEQALKVSLATPLLLSCGGAGVSTQGFDAPACDNGNLAVSGLMPVVAADYLELRSIFMFGAGSPSEEHKLSASGTQCGTATDLAACNAALSALKSSKGWGLQCVQLCSAQYLATTKKDAVTAIDTVEALKAFLGTIDTAQEAVLLASTQPITISCGGDLSRGSVRKTEKGWEVIGSEGTACGEGTAVTQHVLEVDANGNVKELSKAVLEKGMPGCAIGRRPCGLFEAYGPRAQSALARHFVSAAHLEAASVPAFLTLRDELCRHGAPVELLLKAALSARDEVRHARVVAQLARRFGGCPVPPRVAAMPLRALKDVALDNAVEGCVRETFGALVAHRQALRAGDPHVRAAMQTIAADETRHAALSWDVHEWALPRLSRDERASVRAAQREAVATLRAESAQAVEPELTERAGMPPADEAVTLVDALAQTLWS